MKLILTVFSIFAFTLAQAQGSTIKVAFIGNSYTVSNNLPSLIDGIANATGDDLIYSSNTPGGYTLNGHSTNSATLNLIAADNWDYVVIQDQSQYPSFPQSQVVTEVYPYAKILSDSVRAANECAIPVFFNTWGRLNGDPQWDSVNTFERMNNRLYLAYNHMANVNSGKLSPVGLAFKAVYDSSSAIVSHASLYTGDGSHPSLLGSYLAACVFYNTLFDDNSVGNTFLPQGLSQAQANFLQQIASDVMYMGTSPIFDYTHPFSEFSYLVSGNQVSLTNTSLHAFTYLWDFDDNTTSTDENPIHTYSQNGTYTIKLTASYCDRVGTYQQTITINSLNIDNYSTSFKTYPNPTVGIFYIHGETLEEVFVANSLGEVIIQKPLSSGKNEIDLMGQPAGIYIVKVKNNSGVRAEKLIKL